MDEITHFLCNNDVKKDKQRLNVLRFTVKRTFERYNCDKEILKKGR